MSTVASFALYPRSLSRRERLTLWQFVLLSLALHIAVVFMFGSVSGLRRGEGAFGSLDVTLRPALRRDGAAPALPAEKAPPEGVRSSPSVARQSPSRVEPAPAIREPSVPSPVEQAAARLARPAPDTTLRLVAPPTEMGRIVAPPVDRARAPPVELPLRAAPVAPAPLPRLAAPPRQREQAATVELPMRESPVAPSPIERLVPPIIERETAAPVEVPPLAMPVVPTPIERLIAPAVQREVVPPIELPPLDVPLVPAPIERLAPPPVARERNAPVELPTREGPIAPASPLAEPRGADALPPATEAPGIPQAQPAPAAERSSLSPERVPATQAPAPATQAPAPAAQAPAPAAQAPTPADAVPGENLPRLRFGTPDVDKDLFTPRAGVVTPPSTPDGVPRINLEAAKQRAREIASEGSGTRGLVPFGLPAPGRQPEKTPLDKAIKPDCRTAYAGLGLLAIPILLANAIGDGSCRW